MEFLAEHMTWSNSGTANGMIRRGGMVVIKARNVCVMVAILLWCRWRGSCRDGVKDWPGERDRFLPKLRTRLFATRLKQPSFGEFSLSLVGLRRPVHLRDFSDRGIAWFATYS